MYIAEKMIDEALAICVVVCSIISPFEISVDVPVAAEYRSTPNKAIREIPNDMKGRISPNHLFSFFERYTCKIITPAQTARKKTKNNVILIAFSPQSFYIQKLIFSLYRNQFYH